MQVFLMADNNSGQTLYSTLKIKETIASLKSQYTGWRNEPGAAAQQAVAPY